MRPLKKKKKVQFLGACVSDSPGASLCLWCKGDIFFIPDIVFI